MRASSEPPTGPPGVPRSWRSWRFWRFWPVLAIGLALALAYAAGVQRVLSFAWLGQQQQALQGAVAAHPVRSAALYAGLYVAVSALSMPGAVVITLAGGLLFGTWAGGALAVAGASAGATLLFLAARHALGGWLAAKAGGMLDRVRPGLERDGFSYLLALRLIPLVPFWLVNLAAGVVRMRLAVFVAGTVLGIIPGTFVFASVGAGLGAVLAQGGTPDLSIVTRAAVLLPLLGLALLSLLPVAWRHLRASHA